MMTIIKIVDKISINYPQTMKNDSISISKRKYLTARSGLRAMFFLRAQLVVTCVATVTCLLALKASANPGDLYVSDLATNSILVFAPDGTQRTFATGLNSPQGIAFDHAKNLYVADAGSGSVFKYDLAGNKTTFYPPPGSIQPALLNPIGLTLDGSDLLVAENGGDRVTRLPLDSIPPRALFTAVTAPLGLSSHAFDQAGFTRYIAHDNSVLEVAPDLTTTDVPLGVGTRSTAAISRILVGGGTERDVFISTDAGTIVTIVNNGPPTSFAAGLTQPNGMDFRPQRFSGDTDRVGNLYVADTAAGNILMFTPTGTQTAFVSGVGSPNFVAFEVQSPQPPSPVLLQNISTRADVMTEDNVLIAGFIITGGDVSTPKEVVIRAIGPSLSGVTDALQDPTLQLLDSNANQLAFNDNWQDGFNLDELNRLGLAPTNDAESAIVANLPSLDPTVAGSGEYTAIVRGKGNTTGVAVVEVYDVDDPATTVTELANISSRAFVATEDNVLIEGLIIGPASNQGEVILRAIGPSLPVVGALQDPTLELLDVNANQLAFNDNWQDGFNVDELNRTMLAPTNDAESAIVATLAAGEYTAIVRGKGATTGVGLVEAYHIIAAPANWFTAIPGIARLSMS
jgi:hypothetical protein